MRKLLILLMLLGIASGCVKDSSELLSNDNFNVSVNGTDISKTIFTGDNYTRYTIEIAAHSGTDIDNGKSATISVSDGTLSAANNLVTTSTTNTINVSIIGNKCTFYYIAGSKSVPNALLSISIDGLIQTFSFAINASEPEKILLSPSLMNPTINDNVDITAFLVKSNSTSVQVSTGLKIFFTVAKVNATDAIVPSVSVPGYTMSILDNNSFTTAKTTITTNKKPGAIVITASYTKTDGSIITGTTTLNFQ